MITSLRRYGSYPERGESHGTSAATGRAAEGRAAEEQGADELPGYHSDVRPPAFPPDASAPTPSTFDRRHPSFSDSFPRPSSAPAPRGSTARRYRPLRDADGDSSTPDAAELLSLLEAALDEAEELRGKVASEAHARQAAEADLAAAEYALVEAQSSRLKNEAEAQATRAKVEEEAAKVPALQAEVRRLVIQRDEFRGERDMARAQLATSRGLLAAAHARSRSSSATPPHTASFPTNASQATALADLQARYVRLRDERDVAIRERDIKQSQLDKLRGEETKLAIQAVRDSEERERWEREMARLRREVEVEREGKERAQALLTVRRGGSRAESGASSPASAAETTAASPGGSDRVSLEQQIATLTASLAAVQLSHSALESRLVELEPAKTELEECLRVLDELVLEHEGMRKAKESLAARVRELEGGGGGHRTEAGW
ncbi:hypothetical protein JCM10213_001008 [Rhodosporidiobolus nylandii]